MSRSIGDDYASKYGVISTPEIAESRLLEEDKILIIGSDGL